MTTKFSIAPFLRRKPDNYLHERQSTVVFQRSNFATAGQHGANNFDKLISVMMPALTNFHRPM
jgi:hypothetical protein